MINTDIKMKQVEILAKILETEDGKKVMNTMTHIFDTINSYQTTHDKRPTIIEINKDLLLLMRNVLLEQHSIVPSEDSDLQNSFYGLNIVLTDENYIKVY